MLMKSAPYVLKILAFLCFTISIEKGSAQNVGISAASGFTPDASAGLDISYTDKGLLIPRVALTATNVASPITAPAVSLLVYNTATAGTLPNNVIPGYYYWNGTAWVMLSYAGQTQSANWLTTGNSGTNYKTSFLGNMDNASLRFRTNNTARVIIDSLGNVGIGNEIFDTANPEKLMVDAGTTASNNLIGASGSINSFLQFNIQNLSNGAAASTDMVATANNGTDNSAYIDMGINSAGYTTTTGVAGITTKPNTAYLYANAGDMVIGNGATNNPLIFFTNSGTAGTTTPNGSERMRIDGATGNVGIGTTAAGVVTAPAQKLDVVGNIRTTGSVYVDAATTNAGAVTPGVLFGGTNSGEGIASQRTAGNQNGLDFYTNFTNRMTITNAGYIGMGTISPSATLHLKAGAAGAKTAPLKFTAGTNMTTPEAGAVEFDGNNYFVSAGTTRYTLAKTLTATATLDFPSTGNSSSLTVTVPGAADGDVVTLGIPSAAILANASYYAYVSAANTVTVMFINHNTVSAQNPAAGTFRVSVIKY
jgi:hypothetical protein